MRGLVLLLVASLYAAACVCPAVKVDEGGHACTAIRIGTLPGFGALLLGWIPPLTIPWSANGLLVTGAIFLLFKQWGVAACLGSAAALAGLSTWAFAFSFQELLVGYYLWQGSLLSFAGGTLALWYWQPAQARMRVAVEDADPIATAIRAEP